MFEIALIVAIVITTSLVVCCLRDWCRCRRR